MQRITADILYNLKACEHRFSMDLFADAAVRDEPNPFVQLLWERGSLYEHEVVENLEQPFEDLSALSREEKERATLDAMDRKVDLIYGGRIAADDLLGDPDFLKRQGDMYVAGDIKSGAGLEGTEDLSKPKPRYVVQVALYTDILERMGRSAGRRPFIWDINGDQIAYDLEDAYGPKSKLTLWQDYQDTLQLARRIGSQEATTTAAYSGDCKLCHWYTACLADLEKRRDLTLIPELGRSRRGAMASEVTDIPMLATADTTDFFDGKKTRFAGIGQSMLTRFGERAKLINDAGKPYLRNTVPLPAHDLELFFDIEHDPMRDICYLHGFVERRGKDNGTERYIAFFADTPTDEAEKKAFAESIAYITSSQPAAMYYYSKYERTIYRKLQKKHPDVCDEATIEEIFDPAGAVDLYFDVVLKATEWPTRDYSIKTLAHYLGFGWRDNHPSGAASIEWFHRWVQSGDEELRQRILDYNEDDCRATRVLLDGIRSLS